jgi:hypothetical protein
MKPNKALAASRSLLGLQMVGAQLSPDQLQNGVLISTFQFAEVKQRKCGSFNT